MLSCSSDSSTGEIFRAATLQNIASTKCKMITDVNMEKSGQSYLNNVKPVVIEVMIDEMEVVCQNCYDMFKIEDVDFHSINCTAIELTEITEPDLVLDLEE